MAKIDKRIKQKLKEIAEARKEADKFSAHGRGKTPEPVKLMDVIKMSLANDTHDLKVTEFHLLLAEKYPARFSKEWIEYHSREKRRLEKRVASWKKKEFPKNT